MASLGAAPPPPETVNAAGLRSYDLQWIHEEWGRTPPQPPAGLAPVRSYAATTDPKAKDAKEAPREPEATAAVPPVSSAASAATLAALQEVRDALKVLTPPMPPLRLAPPVLLHLAACPESASDTEFQLQFDPMVRCIAGSTVYLSDISFQGVKPTFQTFGISVSFVSPAMYTTIVHSRGRFFVSAPSAAGIVTNGTAPTTARCTETRDFPARLVGVMSTSGVNNCALTFEGYDPVAGSFASPWIDDSSVAVAEPAVPDAEEGSPEMAAYLEAKAAADAARALARRSRSLHLVLVIVPPPIK